MAAPPTEVPPDTDRDATALTRFSSETACTRTSPRAVTSPLSCASTAFWNTRTLPPTPTEVPALKLRFTAIRNRSSMLLAMTVTFSASMVPEPPRREASTDLFRTRVMTDAPAPVEPETLRAPPKFTMSVSSSASTATSSPETMTQPSEASSPSAASALPTVALTVLVTTRVSITPEMPDPVEAAAAMPTMTIVSSDRALTTTPLRRSFRLEVLIPALEPVRVALAVMFALTPTVART